MSSTTQDVTISKPTRQWWKTAAVYQIYPANFCMYFIASFKDSNGDGIGDLPGIISKLDYLKSIGIDALWLSPFYESPNYDMGYDISDYTKPDPSYGSLSDIDTLIKEAHNRGLKVLFDLVINHTSHLHPWFKDASSSKDSKYRDYYIWRPPVYVDGIERPPTNWKGAFGGSTWEWSEETGEYYLHIFTKEQPDLNWESEKVRDHIFQDSIVFWLDRGVDGFRIDTIHLYSKPEFKDVEIVDKHSFVQPARHAYAFGPRLGEILQEMQRKTFEKYGAVSIGEFGGTHDTAFMLDFVAEDQKKFNMAIRFDNVFLDHSREFPYYPASWELPDLKRVVSSGQELADPKYNAWLCNYLENHDQARCVSRFGDDSPEFRERSAKMLAMHLATLSGTLLLYQGQEIGMINMPKDWGIEEYIDAATIMHWQAITEAAKTRPEKYNMETAWSGLQLIARDHARSPMQWDSTMSGGFSSSEKTWMRVMDSYGSINVAQQESSSNSPLNFWREMLSLRKEHQELFVFGKLEMLDLDNKSTMCYIKQSYEHSGGPMLFVALNFSGQEQPVQMPARKGAPKLLLSSTGSTATEATRLDAWEGRMYLLG